VGAVSGQDRPDDRLAEAVERLVEQGEREATDRLHGGLRDELLHRAESARVSAGGEEAPAPAGGVGAPEWRRVPDQLPLEKVERLDALLAERKRAGKPRRGRLTLASIARQVGFNVDRVRQCEKLRERGWDLRETISGVPVDEGFVRLPQP
jgi:hypothetical protein